MTTPTPSNFTISKGNPYPLGATAIGNEINFAVASSSAETLSLCFFSSASLDPVAEFPLVPATNKTGDVWHIAIGGVDPEMSYAYKVKSNGAADSFPLLLDPYAKGTTTSHAWQGGTDTKQKRPYRPYGTLPPQQPFDWENDVPPAIPLNQLIIYEMHVRAYTQDPSSGVAHPGTFLGVIEKIPHLVELGVNAVELLPVHEFDEGEYARTHPGGPPLCNFWGYSTINFFSPMNRYASSNSLNEFKSMVKELHKNGIEVILDVVYNHTGEGEASGPVYSYKGLDKASYYMLDGEGEYLNFSRCGNTFNANYPVAMELIIDSLRYWVAEMHVDGFRFDLASALTRRSDGHPLDSAPLIQAITEDPILSKVKLIAEPWDAAGLYQVGHFAKSSRWMEWNGKYRDCIRRFIKGVPWMSGEFATRICGSQDLYQKRGPCNSINFVTCHDGFSLEDLVSYNKKHNLDNGEKNNDGSNDNESWNCGVEGPTTNHKILDIRERQKKNFLVALFLSQGVPMVTMGDEYGHTKKGNNNTWCQDNPLNWFQWKQLHSNQAFARFFRLMLRFRKENPALWRSTFLTGRDIDWHSIEPHQPDWNSNIPFVAFTLKDPRHERDIYVAFNSQAHAQTIELPHPPYSKSWRWVVNTSNPSPEDIFDSHESPILQGNTYKMAAYSSIVLRASN